jgi:hypothetical protein
MLLLPCRINLAADKCEWSFGTTYATPSGAKANMVLGGQNYLIQQVSFQ